MKENNSKNEINSHLKDTMIFTQERHHTPFSILFNFLLSIEGQGGVLTLFEYCNLTMSFPPRVVFQQRSIFVGLVEFPLSLESWP